MRELSLNILDIAKNSVKAKASLVEILVDVNDDSDEILIEIKDNGCGMTEEFLKTVVDPFSTTRKTRKVGMGIPLFKEACETAGGRFQITSKVGVGTTTTGVFKLNHIDRMPLGNLTESVMTLVMGDLEIEFLLNVRRNGESFTFDTREIKDIVGDTLDAPEVMLYIREFLRENINNILGENV